MGKEAKDQEWVPNPEPEADEGDLEVSDEEVDEFFESEDAPEGAVGPADSNAPNKVVEQKPPTRPRRTSRSKRS